MRNIVNINRSLVDNFNHLLKINFMNKNKQETDELPKFKTNYNAHLFPRMGRRSQMPSKTVPDQSLPVSEIIRRFTRGIPVENYTTPLYDEEGTMPDPRRMDIEEWHEMRENATDEANYLRTTPSPASPPNNPPGNNPEPAKQPAAGDNAPLS